jgi:hypothetical protein
MTTPYRAGPHKGPSILELRKRLSDDMEQANESLPPTADELAAHIREGHVPPEIEAQWRRMRPDLVALLKSDA